MRFRPRLEVNLMPECLVPHLLNGVSFLQAPARQGLPNEDWNAKVYLIVNSH